MKLYSTLNQLEYIGFLTPQHPDLPTPQNFAKISYLFFWYFFVVSLLPSQHIKRFSGLSYAGFLFVLSNVPLVRQPFIVLGKLQQVQIFIFIFPPLNIARKYKEDKSWTEYWKVFISQKKLWKCYIAFVQLRAWTK